MLRLIINNSLSLRIRTYLKEQYIVNHPTYPNTVVEAVAMITSFRNDDGDRDRGNKNTNKIPQAIVSIHLANVAITVPNQMMTVQLYHLIVSLEMTILMRML